MEPSTKEVPRGRSTKEVQVNHFTNPWYAQPNDLVGGWCIMLRPDPPSKGGTIVADMCSESVARYIARIHNMALFVTRLHNMESARDRS